MERKIVQVEGKIQSYEQVKVQHQKTLRNKCKQFQAEKQAELASLRATFLAREEHRVRRQSELLGKYGKQKQAQTQHLQKYKQEIQGTVDKKSQEVKKLNEEIVEIKNQNAVLHKQLQTLVRE